MANDNDDPAFIRAATTPRRGIGQATLQALGQFAAERQLSLFEAIFEIDGADKLAGKQLEPLQVFGQFIQRIQSRAGRKAGAALLRSEEHTSELQSLMRNSYAVFCLKHNTL